MENPVPRSKHKSLQDALEISIVDAEHAGNNLVTYVIEIKSVDSAGQDAVSSVTRRRQYSDFEALRDHLENTYPYLVIPPVPEKKSSWQNVTNEADTRRITLERFLQRIISHPILAWDPVVTQFLQQDQGWKPVSTSISYFSKALQTLGAAYMLKKHSQFDTTKHYSSELHSHLSNLLRVRTKLMRRLHVIHGLHANYGRVFSEWSAIEVESGEALQRAGHYFDGFSSLITPFLEDEEQFADHLKDYVLYTDSVKNVCRKVELLQYTVEKNEESVNSKSQQRDSLIQGKGKVRNWWFANTDTDQMRQNKLLQLDREVEDAKRATDCAKLQIRDFSAKAMTDVKYFQTLKDKDLHRALLMYTASQVKLCRKGISMWTNIRDSLQRM